MLPTPERAPDSVPVLNATPYSAFTQSWQLQPPAHAQILIVKGTFDLVDGEPARVAEDQELPCGEVPFDDAPECVRYPGDLAFFKPRCDVLLAGNAHPPTSGPAIARVQVVLGRALDFAIAVVGDRRWVRGAPSEPARMQKIPLRPDLAYGGEGDEANPLGRGRSTKDGDPLPNLERIDRLIRSTRDAPPPALVTPIPATWRARMRFAGTYGDGWAKTRAPYFPIDFDWRFFNAAPEELQIPYPRGDESYTLSGVFPDRPAFSGKLPGIRVRAFAQPCARPDELVEVPMNLDTVFFDPEARKLVLVWRGATRARDMYGSDLASFFVREEPTSRPLDRESERQLFVATYDAQSGGEPDEVEPEQTEAAPGPPAGGPRGLTPAAAVALGLPPWVATVPGDPPPAPPPPPPEPALSRAEIEALISEGGSLAGLDLSHGDLRGLDLAGRDLSASDLTSCDLREATLRGAKLAGAVLSEVRAEGVDFSEADLTEAELSLARLSGSDFRDAILSRASLNGVLCADARFERAKLVEASLIGAELLRSRFDGADLSSADLSTATLEEARMTGAKLEDARLYDVRARALIADDAKAARLRADGADLTGASLQRVEAPESSIRAATLTDADLRKAVFVESVFEDAKLERALFSQVDARESRFPRAYAAQASFLKANLTEAHLESATFEGADLRGANLYRANTFGASFQRANLAHAILAGSGLE